MGFLVVVLKPRSNCWQLPLKAPRGRLQAMALVRDLFMLHQWQFYQNWKSFSHKKNKKTAKNLFCFTPNWLWQEFSLIPQHIAASHGAMTRSHCCPAHLNVVDRGSFSHLPRFASSGLFTRWINEINPKNLGNIPFGMWSSQKRKSQRVQKGVK